jgi:hypothetical protein
MGAADADSVSHRGGLLTACPSGGGSEAEATAVERPEHRRLEAGATAVWRPNRRRLGGRSDGGLEAGAAAVRRLERQPCGGRGGGFFLIWICHTPQ